MYIKRHAEKTVEKLLKMFGAILVTGPRQVGKTTMLDQLTKGLSRATLDDPIMRAAAEIHSGTFFLDNPPPVFVDEVQKAPVLFEQIKLCLDKSKKKGQFYPLRLPAIRNNERGKRIACRTNWPIDPAWAFDQGKARVGLR